MYDIMYKCADCGAEFDEPQLIRDEITGLYNSICPECGSEEIEEGSPCIMCGMRYARYRICDHCVDDLPPEKLLKYIKESDYDNFQDWLAEEET